MGTYTQLVKEVFGNAKGIELLEEWQKQYGDRLSFHVDETKGEMLVREGERKFYLDIKAIMETKE